MGTELWLRVTIARARVSVGLLVLVAGPVVGLG